MPFIKKFLLAYFGAIAGTLVLVLFILPFFFAIFSLMIQDSLFTGHPIDRAYFFILHHVSILVSLVYLIISVVFAWFLKKSKNWHGREIALLTLVSLVTWGIVFFAYRTLETEQVAISRQQEKARDDLAAQVMRITGARTRFIGLDRTNPDYVPISHEIPPPSYEGIVSVDSGISGTYEYTITVDAGGVRRTFGPSQIALTYRREPPALPPFSVAVNEVVREWVNKNLSTTAVQTGFDLSFQVSATLRLVKDAQGLLINGPPADVNSFLANDKIFVLWDNGAMRISERKKAVAEGDACTNYFDCQNITCPERDFDGRGCGYSKSCQQGRCVCQVVCS